MQGSGSRRFIASGALPSSRLSFSATGTRLGGPDCGHFALSAAAFLHSERNFLRSLPLSPLASASFEHSSEAAVLAGFSAFFSAGAIFGAGVGVGAGVAGAVVCANAELISSRDAKAVAATWEEIVVIESTSG